MTNASSSRQLAVVKPTAVGKRGGVLNHAWIDDKEFMAAVELARRPWAVPDIFEDIIVEDSGWKNAVAPFYKHRSLDDAYATLVPMSINKALTFLILYRGWDWNGFVKYTEMSQTTFYNILLNRKKYLERETLISVVLTLAPGNAIGEQILMKGGIYLPDLDKEIIGYLHNCREIAQLCIIRTLLQHAGVVDLLPDKLL